ncbi:hypothetical protein GCM10010512_34740 [Streptomyces thermoviolaceus subsp. thermoviolaceus]|nr:hypothetical protein GCM10010512_34740 [Streptomyces thermoviolaceus subsp. thermoviolaceus]
MTGHVGDEPDGPAGDVPDAKRSARGSRVTPVTRSSTARASRDSGDTGMIPAMKQPPILTPSGRSTTFAAVVYRNTVEITANTAVHARRPRWCAEMVTAMAAEEISTRTPVAYAPRCRSMPASEIQVTRKPSSVHTKTSSAAPTMTRTPLCWAVGALGQPVTTCSAVRTCHRRVITTTTFSAR